LMSSGVLVAPKEAWNIILFRSVVTFDIVGLFYYKQNLNC
jgi:hypothetical protein